MKRLRMGSGMGERAAIDDPEAREIRRLKGGLGQQHADHGGTMDMPVTRSCLISCSSSGGRKRASITCPPAGQRIGEDAPAGRQMAKRSGMKLGRRRFQPGIHQGVHAFTKRLAWLSITPLARPCVLPV